VLTSAVFECRRQRVPLKYRWNDLVPPAVVAQTDSAPSDGPVATASMPPVPSGGEWLDVSPLGWECNACNHMTYHS